MRKRNTDLDQCISLNLQHSHILSYFFIFRQIWTGHEHSSICIYDVSLENRLVFAANIGHGESQVDVTEKSCVSHMVTTGTDSTLLWSVLSHGSKVIYV